MQPVCKAGCSMYAGTCLCACPANTEPASEDPTRCVPNMTCETYAAAAALQLGISPSQYLLNTDPTFGMLCIKTAQTKDVTCPTGFSEWQSGYCYLNCPAPLQESGVYCVKKSITREATDPTCDSWFYSYNGTSCSLNPLFLAGLAVLLVVIYFFMTSGAPRYQRR